MSFNRPFSRLLGRVLIFCSLIFAAVTARAEPVEVLASIKPLALIARELVAPEDQVSVLLPPGVSPHAYAMRVSERSALENADVIVWVGPELEGFLTKAVRANSGQSLAAADLKGVHWPESVDAQLEHSGHSHTHGHSHGHSRDMHLWLNPQNAGVIARELSARLVALRPQRADYYRQRAAAFEARLAELDAALAAQLAPVQGRGFAVYHDGYAHFVEHYGLNQVDFVAVTPEQRPGARHLYHLQQHLPQAASCLFVEPYADADAVSDMAERLGLRVATLDPLASAAGLDSYGALLQDMGGVFSACLSAD
ncbi:zinc ABC transporter substrate-binding protein [Gilvimarinus sp. DA14]|uniref:zinc ABC transporter substrate-binding protein n=1 Tax=Gilvimarinus sp. DA14 TaxID=2956798 RepID=UPI0020B759B7|nr:zinc ABC transporter substrate-binding protein [Gilvimarinus sp. DA14]UTF59180.1 zinc ABC transporter substrate-binding protein [Gilvimarinus sp. DA14]